MTSRGRDRPEHRLLFLDLVPDATVVVDADGRVIAANSQVQQVFGWAAADLIGQSVEVLVPQGLAGRHVRARRAFLSGARRRPMGAGSDLLARRADGSEIPVEISLNPLVLDGELHVVASARDVSDRRQAERALRAKEERFRRVFEDAPIGVGLVDAVDGRLLEANRELLAMLPGREHGGAGSQFLDLIHPEDRSRAAEAFDALRRGDRQSVRIHGKLLAPDGSFRVVKVAASLVGDLEHGDAQVVVQVEDITAEHEVKQRLLHLALHDELTGLPNRTLLSDRLEHACAAAARTGSWVAVMFLDLDYFKTVNDELGHDAGDELLRQVAQRLTGALRPGDTAARVGGDEFVVCCGDLGPDERAARTTAFAIAGRVAHALRGSYAIDGRSAEVDVSVGLALADGATASPDGLLRDADSAMYQAKQRGRGRLETYGATVRLPEPRRADEPLRRE